MDFESEPFVPRTRTLRLPFPPSVNGYWRVWQGMNRLSKRGRQYRVDVLAGIAASDVPAEPFSGRLKVLIELTMPDNRKRDLDNHGGKAVLDALEYAGVYLDDAQIDELIIRRLHVEPPGCCDVTITEYRP